MENFDQPIKHIRVISGSNVEDLRTLAIGEKFIMGDVEYEVQEIKNASDVALDFDLKINRDIPIIYLKGFGPGQGGYQPKADLIVIFENNNDPTTLEHELIHAVEYHIEPTPELLALYEKAKHTITNESFAESGFFNWNFLKNIHEFIAEGRTKLKPILQKEGLWDDFQKETSYIFNNE